MTIYPFTTEGLSGALAALGGTPGQVADTLLDLGHRGNPNCDSSCPVALYLRDLWPDAACSVTEDPAPGRLVAEVWFDTTRCVQAPLPEPVERFVRRFDGGDSFVELNQHVEVA